jgi:hypothetical protein
LVWAGRRIRPKKGGTAMGLFAEGRYKPLILLNTSCVLLSSGVLDSRIESWSGQYLFSVMWPVPILIGQDQADIRGFHGK